MRTRGTQCVILAGVLGAAASVVAAPVAAQDEARQSEAREAAEAPVTGTRSPNDRPTDEARIAFEAGRDAFDAGRYPLALESFERAYELTEHPDILYNIAHTAERLRRDERALSAFEGYLEANPDSPERAAIEARMVILRRAIEERAEDESVRPVEPAGEAAPLPVQEYVFVQAPPGPSEPSPLGWVLTGVGAVVAVTGVGFLVGAEVRAGEVRDAADGTPWPDLEQAYADADNFAIAGGVLAGVGAATAALGVVLALTAQGDQEVAVGPGGVTVRGRF